MGRGFCQDEAPEFSYSRTLTYASIPVDDTYLFRVTEIFAVFQSRTGGGIGLGSSIDANFDYDKL